MPHASLKLIPGVDQNKTPALNEAAISDCNLIRFVPDRNGLGLPQKLGGWTKFYTSSIPYTVRALHAWADTNSNSRLGVGTDGDLRYIGEGGEDAGLISPQTYSVNQPPDAYMTSGSSLVEITDIGSNLTSYDSVRISTPISAGGVVLSGYYPCIGSTPDAYNVVATNVLTAPILATATTPTDLMTGMDITSATCAGSTVTIDFTGNYLIPVGSYVIVEGVTGGVPAEYNGMFKVTASTAGATSTVDYEVPNPIVGAGGTASAFISYVALPVFATVDGSINVTVTLNDHQLDVGSTFPILVQVSVGGMTLSTQNYIVREVDGNDFVITGNKVASSDAAAVLNDNMALYTYYIGQSAVGGTTGFGSGGFGFGGFGVGVAFTGGRTLVLTGATCVGTTATITFDEDIAVPVGSTVIVAGVTPADYDSETSGGAVEPWIVTASASGSLSYEVPVTIGSSGTGGTVVINSWGYIGAQDWSLDNWGEYLIAAPYQQEIYYWNPSSGADHAEIVPYAPQINEGAFVAMPQRQIVAYGSTFTGIQDPLLIRWSDISNLTNWVGTPINQAGSYRIPKGSKIVGGMQGPQQGLIWTDTGLWSMQYINMPYIYSFNEVSAGCGLIGRKAMGTLAGTVYWMSQSQFFKIGSGGVEPVPCPVWDVIFQQIDMDYVDNVRCAVNSRFGEVAWYYPISGSGGEPTNYVKYNALINQWDFGELTRTAWIDQSVLGAPIGAGYGGAGNVRIYQHEMSTDADGSALRANFTTGYFALSDGDVKTFIDQVWPDLKWGPYNGDDSADVKITFYAVDYPGQNPTVHGPYSVSSASTYFTPRIRARLIAIKVSSTDKGSFWRLGNIRYRLQQDGKF